jgi:hypothetical protein
MYHNQKQIKNNNKEIFLIPNQGIVIGEFYSSKDINEHHYQKK